MMFLKGFLIVFFFVGVLSVFASDDHKHSHENEAKTKESSKHNDKHDENDKDNHSDSEHDGEEKGGHAESGHDHEGKENKKDDHKDDGHGEKHGHEEGGEEEEEAPKNVGPNKGIVEFDEHKGFKLSAEAEKTFGISTQDLVGSGPWSIPSSGVLSAGAERSVYKLSNGFLKRTQISVIRKGKQEMIVSSNELRPGDKIVIRGLNFIRTAELDLTSGESGHSH